MNRQCFGKLSTAVCQVKNGAWREGAEMDAHGAVLNPLSKRVIGCGLRVAGNLGNGFLEKVYENALAHELRKAGLSVEQQRGITVMYDGVMVGEYFIDLLVEASLLVELKTVSELSGAHRAQCLNYLRATGMHLCLLMNFGRPRLEVRRIVFDL
jgi:GxxExxY protein